MSDVVMFQAVELPKLQEVHTSPYYQQKEKRKRTQSEASLDSGYSADSPMELADPAAESEACSGGGGVWGMFKSRENFVNLHIC